MENPPRPDLSDDGWMDGQVRASESGKWSGHVVLRTSHIKQDFEPGKPESDAGWEKVFAEAKKLPQYKETLNWQETISIFRTSRADRRKSV